MVFETETVLSYFVVVTCDMRSRVQGVWLVPLLKTYGTLSLFFYTVFLRLLHREHTRLEARGRKLNYNNG